MSVINKMLRDLDQREGASDSVKAPTAGALPLRSGTHHSSAQPRAARAWMPLAIAGVVLLAGGAAWWWNGTRTNNAPAKSAPMAAAPSLMPVPAPTTPVVAAAPVGKETAKLVAKEPAKPIAIEVEKSAPAVALKEVPAAKDSKVVAKEPAKALMKEVAVTAVMPAPAAVVPAPVAKTAPAVVSAVTASPEPVSPAVRQIQAGRDALAQAQALWNAGSHDAAVELLQGAIGVVERNAAASPSTAQTQLLASLARELGRMHLADGRPAAAVDALTRMEPQLGREADIWAMRGNAAQRLGRHQDSVNAYASALQLRPNEQRWLLGSAVSLAALGQTAQASDMLEKARALGPVSKEVQAYLRQAGVRVSEP